MYQVATDRRHVAFVYARQVVTWSRQRDHPRSPADVGMILSPGILPWRRCRSRLGGATGIREPPERRWAAPSRPRLRWPYVSPSPRRRRPARGPGSVLFKAQVRILRPSSAKPVHPQPGGLCFVAGSRPRTGHHVADLIGIVTPKHMIAGKFELRQRRKPKSVSSPSSDATHDKWSSVWPGRTSLLLGAQ